MRIRYGFVILHYMAYDMTVHCVNELLEHFSDKDIHMVIVDNASPNATGKELEDRYKGQDNVTVLYNNENLGFAQGNNAGYEYLRTHGGWDYIIVMNNDVLIRQPDFLEKIHDLYLLERYAVLGPDIYNPYGIRKHQNPFFLQADSKTAVKKNLKMMESNERRFLFYYVKNCVLNALRRIPLRVHMYRCIMYIVLRHGGGVRQLYASA